MTASSGGVKQVASFALRLGLMMLSQPKVRRVQFMDEPFLGVDSTCRDLLADLLLLLSKKMKIQFIYVTHDEAFKVRKVIRI